MSEEIKISQLQEANEISANDLMMIIQNGVNKKKNIKQMAKELSTVAVSATQPTTSEKVWFRNGKNLFDKDNSVKVHMFIDTSSNKFVDNYEQAISTYIKIEGNTTYTISKTAGKTFRVATSESIPANSVKILSTTVNHEGTKITITTETNAKYLFINYYNASNGDTKGEEIMKNSLQIEKNTVATSYEDYVKPAIFVKNNNNVYEEFIKVEELQIISSVTDITLSGYRIGNLCFVNINGSGETFTKNWTNYELGKITGITAKTMVCSTFTNQNGQVCDIAIYANTNTIQLNYRAVTPTSKNSWIRGQLVFVCN